jgi:hypothetical protein
MTVRVLTSALKDLAAGRAFYERQGEGLGAYFFDSIFSDIDSLALYGGIHRQILAPNRIRNRARIKTISPPPRLKAKLAILSATIE